METHQKLIEQAYADFNSRNIDAVLTVMLADVEWPNGWEGGYVVGHDEVRDYWTRQWREINPVVKPIGFRKLSDGRVEVEVLQSAKDMHGQFLFEGKIKHVYEFENGLIKSMEIDNGL